MKFRDPKTGEVFEDIDTAIWTECGRREFCDESCPLYEQHRRMACRKYVISHPAEAARRMGFEVVEDHIGDATNMINSIEIDAIKKEKPMKKQDKPRFTQEEVADFLSSRIERDDEFLYFTRGKHVAIPLPIDLLPSLRPGQNVSIAEILGCDKT